MPDDPEEHVRQVRERLEREETEKNNPHPAPNGEDRESATLSGRPIILVESGKRHIAADQGIDALVKANVPFYQRNRKLQRVARVKAKNMTGEEIMIPGIVPVDAAILGRELGRSALWQRYDMKQKKFVSIDPPSAVAAQILAMVGDWPFAPLKGIIQCPTLRRDGTLLDTSGYDQATGLVLVGSPPMQKLQSRPTKGQAGKALARREPGG
jgi:hypothetical protein